METRQGARHGRTAPNLRVGDPASHSRAAGPTGHHSFPEDLKMDFFGITVDDISLVGKNLNLPMRNGDVYTANSDGGISLIRADGTQEFFGRKERAENGFVPNGSALLPDGSFLIANIGRDGGCGGSPGRVNSPPG